MKKTVLNAASCYNKKYFLNPDYNDMPEAVKNDIKTITVCLAEKLHCIFTIGFYEDGTLYFETAGTENDFDYDEIGAGLEIQKLEREQNELIKSLSLWYLYKIKNKNSPKGSKNENR